MIDGHCGHISIKYFTIHQATFRTCDGALDMDRSEKNGSTVSLKVNLHNWSDVTTTSQQQKYGFNRWIWRSPSNENTIIDYCHDFGRSGDTILSLFGQKYTGLAWVDDECAVHQSFDGLLNPKHSRSLAVCLLETKTTSSNTLHNNKWHACVCANCSPYLHVFGACVLKRC